jgi:hypothetical protein
MALNTQNITSSNDEKSEENHQNFQLTRKQHPPYGKKKVETKRLRAKVTIFSSPN